MCQLRLFALVVLTFAALIGCKSDSQQSLVSNIGSYGSAPTIANKPKLGVTAFKIEDDQPTQSSQALSNTAADEMVRLILRSGRFEVVDRTATAEILERSKLVGIIRPGRLVQTATVPGIDYVLLGSISNLHIKRQAPRPAD